MCDRKNRKYQFNVNFANDINYQMIKNDLTKENPVAIVVVNKKMADGTVETATNVMVHPRIMDKARLLGATIPRVDIETNVASIDCESDIAEILEVVSQVKRAKWPTKYQVKVALPDL